MRTRTSQKASDSLTWENSGLNSYQGLELVGFFHRVSFNTHWSV